MKTTSPQTRQKDLQTIKTVKHLYNYNTIHKHVKTSIPFPLRRNVHRDILHTEVEYLKWLSAVKVAMRLTYDTDLPDFNKGTLNVLDVRQTLVQV